LWPSSASLSNVYQVVSFGTVGEPATTEIYLLKLDGTKPVQLTSNGARDGAPNLFQDRLVAFSSDRDGNNEIYVMNADGADVRRLTNDPADDGTPAWSANGKRVAFTSKRRESDEKADIGAERA